MAELRIIHPPVILPLLHRATAWLCLALVLLTGLMPAQGFVVCIEQDGCVSFEIKAPDADCSGCEGHDQSAAGIVGAQQDLGDPACPCIDLPVPGSTDERAAATRLTKIHVGPLLAPSPELRLEKVFPTAEAARGLPSSVPRVAQSLTHIHSVVLLV